VKIFAPDFTVVAECERILRTLPRWFGNESALVGYAKATASHLTFVADDGQGIKGFLVLQQHFPETWEIHCIAVDAAFRNRGVGKALLGHAEDWLREASARLLQVKTLAAGHDSPEYAETREFYKKVGFVPIETYPQLWGPDLPVLQMIKVL
jgi:GNAT superfamily N-acetyltransferase